MSLQTVSQFSLLLRHVLGGLLLIFISEGPVEAARTVYPLKISSNARHLVDQADAPFLITADTGWHLFYKLTLDEVDEYLADRALRGFNAVQVQLLTDDVEAYPTRGGVLPLTIKDDLSAPNEAFFAHVDRVVAKAGEHGILLILAPAWLGCCEGGWKHKLKANGTQKCEEFGRFLGRRYRDSPNIMWLHGGDRDPGEFMPFVRAMALGVKAEDARHLSTAHAGSPRSAMEVYGDESWLDVNNTYTYSPNITGTGRAQHHVYAASQLDYQRQTVKPFYLIESAYENERGATPQWIRRQAYWSILSGSAGQAMGNRPIYLFDPGWQAALDQPASREISHLQRLFNALPWHNMVPDKNQAWLIDGGGTFESRAGSDPNFARGFDYATVALSSDHTCAVAYIPTPRPVTLDLTRMATAKLEGCWFDPRSGVASRIENSLLSKKLAPPGDGDWLLVVAPETTIGPLLTRDFVEGSIGTVVTDLSSDGALDWILWGVKTASMSVRKAAVDPLIGEPRISGGGKLVPFDDAPVGFSWKDGPPDQMKGTAQTGLLVEGNDNGFQFSIASSKTARVLKLHAAVWRGRARIELLQDGRALAGMENSDPNNPAEGAQGIYTVALPGSEAGTDYEVRFSLVEGTGLVALHAATLNEDHNAPSATIQLEQQEVDLTAEGKVDWVYHGLPGPVRKNGSKLIGDLRIIGSSQPQPFDDSSFGYSWSDGAPVLEKKNLHNGVYVIGRGNGFEFSVPAKVSPQILKIYVGVWKTQGRLDVSWSDSEPHYSDHSIVSAAGALHGVYTLKFAAEEAGKSLLIRYRADTSNTGGNVNLQAVTLSE